jgi:hypothetical protein
VPDERRVQQNTLRGNIKTDQSRRRS